MPVIELTFDVEDIKEASSTIKFTLKKLNWVIDNKPPNKSELDKMKKRSEMLTNVVNQIDGALLITEVVEPKQDEAKKATKSRKHTLRIVDKE
jgi:hypothetical protein